nr:hypothetical protein [Tanacetum cinerariifolium]
MEFLKCVFLSYLKSRGGWMMTVEVNLFELKTDVDKDLTSLAICDLQNFGAQCAYLLSLKGVTLWFLVSYIVEDSVKRLRFSENTPNVVGSGPDWLFDINALTRTMNYEPIAAGTQSNGFAGTKACDNAGQARKEKEHDDNVNNANNVNAASTNGVNVVSENISNELPLDPNMLALKDISTFNFSSDHEDDDEEDDINNMDTTIQVSHVPTTRIHKDHPLDQEIRDMHSTTQTRNMSKNLEEHGFFGDEEGVGCLPTATIFEQLDLMRVLDLEKTKTIQALEIDSLKRRVKKLEKKQRSKTHKLKRLYKVGLSARVESSDDNEDLTVKEVNAAGEVNAASIATTISADATITTEEATLAKALAELKASKPKAKGIVLQEPSESPTTTTIISSKKSQDKGKAKINAAYLLVQRLQAEEQQELTDVEKATLFMQFLKKRRKLFAAKAAKEKRNKPPTQAQQRKIMCTYLKNMEGKKLKELKNKSFDSI